MEVHHHSHHPKEVERIFNRIFYVIRSSLFGLSRRKY